MANVDPEDTYDESEFRDDRLPLCHSNSGRLFAPFSLLKKSNGKTPSKDQIRGITPEASRKGLANEKLFRSMFEALVARGTLPANYRVRRSSRNEDEKFKIDYWIDILQEDMPKLSIPIQLKSSFRGKEEFLQKFGDKVRHIYIIVMHENMTPLRLMRRIFSIVAAFHREQNLPLPPMVQSTAPRNTPSLGLILP